MGKKGSWLSAIKRVFRHTSNSKDKLPHEQEKQGSKERKKRGLGKLKYRDGHSFIPLFREPSSIEKILGEAERENHIKNFKPATPPEQSKIPSHVTPLVRTATLLWDDDSPRAEISPRAPSPPHAASPPRNAPQSTVPSWDSKYPNPLGEASLPPRRSLTPPQVGTPASGKASVRVTSLKVQRRKPEPTLRNQHICATKIQTAYRGYMARRSYRALRSLVRLQGVVKGQSVKRQSANALKCMQMLVRVQTQIQTRRIQMLENQTQQSHVLNKNEKDIGSAFGKWLSENQQDWEDSTLTKEEIEARMKRKFDAIVKRERAMAYAYSHQSWKSTPRISHGALAEFSTGGYPYWWNWIEQRQLPPTTPIHNDPRSSAIRTYSLTPIRPTSNAKASHLPPSRHYGQLKPGSDNLDVSTPESFQSSIAPRMRQARTPPARLSQKFSRGSAATSPFNGTSFRDDDSMTSCPPFSVPRFMSPTASAQAKLKGGKEKQAKQQLQFPDSPSSVTTDGSKRRMSSPLGLGSAGAFKWNKGSLFSNRETRSQRALAKLASASSQSVGNWSVDSSVSMPSTVGRKPFNRFV